MFDGLIEDEDEGNEEHDEKLAEKGKEKMKNKILYKVDNKNAKHDKKERNAKNNITALKDNFINVEEHKVELIKKKLVKYLRLNTERVYVEHYDLQNRSTCVEVRHKVLIE